MRIHYRLRFGDYFLFVASHQFLQVISQVIYVGFGVLIYLGESAHRSTLGAATAGIIAYFAGWMLQAVFNLVTLHSSKNRTLLTDHVVELQPDCFYEENPFSRSFHKWAGIARVVSRPGFVAVYLNGQAAHIVPNRAFRDKVQRDEFLVQIRAKIAAA